MNFEDKSIAEELKMGKRMLLPCKDLFVIGWAHEPGI